jgi:hypothetical protein
MFDTGRKKAFIDGWNKAIDVMQLIIEEVLVVAWY